MAGDNDSMYVAGHRGMLGLATVRRLQVRGDTEIVTATHEELDLTSQAAVQAFFASQQIDCVVLAAAKAGVFMATTSI